MKIMYCDRCGVEHREGVKGGRVVRVTWEPLQRTMDLCGQCRTDLQRALDAFEKQDWPQSTASVERASAPTTQPPLPPAAEGEETASDPSAALTKADGESWEDYAHRLEHRIKAQRDHIKSITALRGVVGNKHERERIARLKRALAHVTEKWVREREARIGLVRAATPTGGSAAAEKFGTSPQKESEQTKLLAALRVERDAAVEALKEIRSLDASSRASVMALEALVALAAASRSSTEPPQTDLGGEQSSPSGARANV